MPTTMQFFDLIDAFEQPGCAVCRLLRRDVARYLDALMYEYVNKVSTHKTFRAARGLCNVHSWQFSGSALGVAILFNAALDEVQNITENQPSTNSGFGLRKNRLADALEPVQSCPACDVMTRTEADYSSILADQITDERLQAAYRGSEGLCLPHFRLVLRANPAHAPRCVEIQQAIWAHLRADLEEFIRKSDFQHRDEHITEAEAESWRQAVAALAGERDMFGLRR
ncbi:MAG: hypothetical protein OHK0046_36290 [Anaerolineae bacterium]